MYSEDYLPKGWYKNKVRLTDTDKLVLRMTKNGIKFSRLKNKIEKINKSQKTKIRFEDLNPECFSFGKKVVPTLYGSAILGALELHISKFGLMLLSYIYMRVKIDGLYYKSDYEFEMRYFTDFTKTFFKNEFAKLVKSRHVVYKTPGCYTLGFSKLIITHEKTLMRIFDAMATKDEKIPPYH